jgi:hypothetical protein
MNNEFPGRAAFLEFLYTQVWFLFQPNPFGKLYSSGFILHMQQKPVCSPSNGEALLQDVCTVLCFCTVTIGSLPASVCAEWVSAFVYATRMGYFIFLD